MESRNDVIKKICWVIIEILGDEKKAIASENWPKLDLLVRRKSRLLAKIDKLGFDYLDDLYIFDPQVVEVRELVQQIVNAEDENARLLREKMMGVKNQLAHVREILKMAVYGSATGAPAEGFQQTR